MIPDLLLVTAGDLRDNELDILGDQLTLLPGDWLTGLSPGPHLVTRGDYNRKSAIYLRRWEVDTVFGVRDLCLHIVGRLLGPAPVTLVWTLAALCCILMGTAKSVKL